MCDVDGRELGAVAAGRDHEELAQCVLAFLSAEDKSGFETERELPAGREGSAGLEDEVSESAERFTDCGGELQELVSGA